MQLTKTHKIIISIVILAILLWVYIAVDRKSQKQDEQDNNANQATTSTTTSSGVKVSVQGGNGYTIEQVPVTSNDQVPQPVPSLTSKIIFNDSLGLTPDTKTLITQKISGLRADLLKNLSYFDAWIDLGIYQKMAGDYQAAITSWQYAGKLSPTNFISFGNLGNLYAYYLKDNTKAETYYKQAISNGPTESYLYVQLAEIYRDIEKDSSKALAIINQGLTKIPNDPSLLQFKSSLQK